MRMRCKIEIRRLLCLYAAAREEDIECRKEGTPMLMEEGECRNRSTGSYPEENPDCRINHSLIIDYYQVQEDARRLSLYRPNTTLIPCKRPDHYPPLPTE